MPASAGAGALHLHRSDSRFVVPLDCEMTKQRSTLGTLPGGAAQRAESFVTVNSVGWPRGGRLKDAQVLGTDPTLWLETAPVTPPRTEVEPDVM